MKRSYLFILTASIIPFLAAHAEDGISPFSVEIEATTLSELEKKGDFLEEESTLSSEPLFTLSEESPQVTPEAITDTPILAEQQQESLLSEEVAPLETPIAVETVEMEEPSVLEIAVEETNATEEPVISTEIVEEESFNTLENSLEQPAALVKMQEDSQSEELTPAANQEIAFNTLNVGTVTPKAGKKIQISFSEVFAGSPIIYSVLLIMSVFSLAIWIYNFLAMRQATEINTHLVKVLREKLTSNQYDEALGVCLQGDNLLCKMLASGIGARKHGQSHIIEIMNSEGKRASASFWQRTAILNDIAIIAPMLGLLGTVLGMFYAFYDLNRSVESMATLFDGLGISVGTTVAGLVVAILAMIFQSSTKYRLVKALSQVENEAKSLTNLLGN